MKILTNKIQRNNIKEKVLIAFNQYISTSKKHLEFPVPIKAISKSFKNVRVIPYSRVMRDENIDYGTMIRRAGTTDAFTEYCHSMQKYIIYYNDLTPIIQTSNRYRWNIAHELGHVLLGHHTKIKQSKLNRTNISDKEYDIFETEADYFASYILSPYPAIRFFNPKSLDDFRKTCQISKSAAEVRFKEYKKWYRNSKFKEEFDIIIARIFAKEKTCTECKNISNPKDIFCSICGNKNFTIGRSKKYMKYDGVAISENGKYSVCPICDNEELENTYCHICGHIIENKCTNEKCGHIAKGNARFCSICGNKTTFLQEKVLLPWDYNPKEVFVNMSSDDLPF